MPDQNKIAEALPDKKDQSPMQSVKMSVPGTDISCNLLVPSNSSDEDFNKILENFTNKRSRLHEIYIRENEQSKRLGLLLAFLLIFTGALIPVFAPKGREQISHWIGVSCIVFAGGAIGYGRVWGKASGVEFGADQGGPKS